MFWGGFWVCVVCMKSFLYYFCVKVEISVFFRAEEFFLGLEGLENLGM